MFRLVRAIYRGESSFNVLYQSPLSNLPGALAGLLLAHLHHYLLDTGVDLSEYKVGQLFYSACSLVILYSGHSAFVSMEQVGC